MAVNFNRDTTVFFLTRIKENVGLSQVAQYNSYNGTIYWYDDRNSATLYETIEEANAMKATQELLAEVTKQNTIFEVKQEDTQVYTVDEAGNKVESKAEDVEEGMLEQPVDNNGAPVDIPQS